MQTTTTTTQCNGEKTKYSFKSIQSISIVLFIPYWKTKYIAASLYFTIHHLCISIHLFTILHNAMPIYADMYLIIILSIYHISNYLTIYQSIYLSIYVFIYLQTSHPSYLVVMYIFIIFVHILNLCIATLPSSWWWGRHSWRWRGDPPPSGWPAAQGQRRAVYE